MKSEKEWYAVKAYRNEFIQLLKQLKQKPVSDLTVDDIRSIAA
jgi:hypothetical protein